MKETLVLILILLAFPSYAENKKCKDTFSKEDAKDKTPPASKEDANAKDAKDKTPPASKEDANAKDAKDKTPPASKEDANAKDAKDKTPPASKENATAKINLQQAALRSAALLTADKTLTSQNILKKAELAILTMVSKTLVIPRIRDVSLFLKMPKQKLEELIGDSIPMIFWNQVKEENPTYITKLKKSIAKAFIASIKSDDIKWKNKTPDIKRLYQVYVEKHDEDNNILPKYLKKELHLSVMLGNKVSLTKKSEAHIPVLFENGMEEVEMLAKKLTPSAFLNYIDTNQFSLESDQQTADMVLQAKGAIVSTVTAGIPTNRDFFESLLKYATRKKVPIILLPVNGQTDGIDPYLLSMPDQVRIVTHTINFSDYLRIWALPVMPKNANPFASLDTYSQGKRGQIQIIGSPQQRYQTVATADNKDITHGLWAPGSITTPLYPSKNPASLRVSELAKNRHAMGALILELADKKSGPNQGGLPGFFYVRPIKYLGNSKQDPSVEQNQIPGFIDLNHLYTNDKIVKRNIDTMVTGDLHDYNANQLLLKVHEDIMRTHNIKTLVLHDALDGSSHNHHESHKLNSKLEKYKRGELNIKDEIEGLIQTMNGFLQKFPDLNIVLVDSNHHYWIENLLDNPDAIKDMPNREFLIELLFARSHLNVNVFEYMFNHHRKTLHDGLEPKLQHKKMKSNLYIVDPNRVKVLQTGEPFIVGPQHNPVYLHFHGHKGANGAKGGMPSHAKAVEQSVIGDSHQPSILGGTVNVGTSTYKSVAYTEGGYSSWQSGIALVDSDTGNAQLILYEAIAGSAWKQDPENGFFPLSLQPSPTAQLTDNEAAPDDAEIIDQYNNKFLKKK